MEEFKRFVTWAGGRQEAADRLGISLSLVRSICYGVRPVSRRTAAKILEEGGRRFSLAKLLEVSVA